ncbi:MAG: superinfection immunity protein [Bryobacteraceae bacterium]|jgi:hypothetical protein
MDGFLFILLIGALYFLPTFIGQSKRNAGAIFTLNLLLGWTVIGWVVALIWAMTVDASPAEKELHVAVAGSFCSGCGVGLPADSRFCTKCGRPASVIPASGFR